ncbi:MAG: N-6 DNA methylase, partial [Nitrospira sp.]|nr:N-6 DNA methylase [Nitrospira sp.]
EAEVRRKIVESGDVDVMISIRSNFFYTRSVPCELWFFDRDKPEPLKDKVLMLDARNVFTKVTRKIYDFSPEQLQNLTAVIWLYRGQADRYLALLESYLQAVIDEARETAEPVAGFIEALDDLLDRLPDVDAETKELSGLFKKDEQAFQAAVAKAEKDWGKAARDNAGLKNAAEGFSPLAESSRDLIKQIDQLYKFAEKLAKESGARGLNKLVKELDECRKEAVEQLKQVRYFHKQAHWLQERFPEAELCDVEGLVKLVDREEIKTNDWSLTPGRYVGVAPEVEDEDFDFEETLRDIHIELQGLNEEATVLAAQIQKNFEELGV